MMAGASAVAVGAMNFHDPYLTQKVVDGMEQYLIRHNISTAREHATNVLHSRAMNRIYVF
jgi:dihydroorotate dehydrogenase (NAD+) catalytic subunit